MVTRQKRRTNKKPWDYIGEFIWLFGTIESYINFIFLKLFDLEDVDFMFIGLIDTRKKLELIESGFAAKDIQSH